MNPVIDKYVTTAMLVGFGVGLGLLMTVLWIGAVLGPRRKHRDNV